MYQGKRIKKLPYSIHRFSPHPLAGARELLWAGALLNVAVTCTKDVK